VIRAVPSRYHPALVALHWLLALVIIGLLCLGFFVLADMPNSDPKKLNILVAHMAAGILVLVLMIFRLIVRVRSAHPKAAGTGSPALDRLASVAHHGLYAIVFLMIASGWCTGFLIRGVFAPHGGHLPATFAVFPTFRIHAALAALLAFLIVGHIAAALYHQFVLKDHLFRRMRFGKRVGAARDEKFSPSSSR
jgi:cytochrome b561